MIHKSFPKDIHEELESYVYVYVDTSEPEEKIFYVGKGRGDRCFSHLKTESDDDKSDRITALVDAKHLRIDLLAFGIDEDTALKVEAAAIDLLGIDNLVNKQGGQRSAELGRIPADDLIARLSSQPIEDIKDNCILIRINKLYRVGMPPLDLYEATRGVWKVAAPNREMARYALAVYKGVVQEVYCIHAWFPAGDTFYGTREIDREAAEGDWEFVGNIAEDRIRKRYLYRSFAALFPNGAINPIRYFGPSFDE